MRQATMFTCLAGGIIIILIAAGAAIGQPPPGEDDDGVTKVHTVAPGEMILRFQQQAHLDSASRLELRVDPEAYRGELRIVEIVTRSGPVEKGAVILRFDTRRLEEEIHQARETLTETKSRLDMAREDRDMNVEAAKIRLERARRATLAAEHELEIWEKYNSDRMLKTAELSVRQRENNLDDQKEELAQLEAMYEGTRLDSETKEIVLERARRNVRMSEQWLEISRNDALITRQYRHPDQDRAVRENAVHKAIELEHVRISNRLNAVRKELEIASLERKVREGARRLDRLERDWDRLTVAAPSAGILTKIDLQVGDTVGGRQVIAELVDPDDLIVPFTAVSSDLRVIAEGDAVDLALPAFPEIDVQGTVRELSGIGSPSGDTAHFDGVITVEGDHPMLRVGLRCRARAEKTLEGVLTLPPDAIREDEGQTYCHVLVDGEAVERDIRLGARTDEMVQIVSGLAAGDQVLLEEPREEGGDDEAPEEG
ncbi:MAG: HlyD family efflux transporter periplasmic adaptor subunit [Planctomycetota bacterium]|nr:HlyD family efflux transporter periplasmic adaptor subunit [Planctomycetota bacterium]